MHERDLTANGAWVRLFDETIAAMRIPLNGEKLTVSDTLNKLSDRDRAVREAAGKAIGTAFARKRPPVLADHQHLGQGQGDRGHVAALPPPRQRPQPRQHGRGRGRRRAGHGRSRILPAPRPPLLPDEGQVARPAEAAALGPQRAAARR